MSEGILSAAGHPFAAEPSVFSGCPARGSSAFEHPLPKQRRPKEAILPKILITPRSLTQTPHPAMKRLQDSGYEVVYTTKGETPKEQELIERVADCVGWLAGVENVTPAVIDAAKMLKVISRNGVGVDNLPMERVKERGIQVVIAEGANSAGVAELTIALTMASLRRIPAADAGIKDGKWPRTQGIEIRNRPVGVVGCGAIGRDVSRLFVALGAHVLGFDPMKPTQGLPAERFRLAELDEVISQTDVVSLHCPASRDGKPLVDAAFLGRMRKGAFLINTARAALIDEAAVLAALESGQLGGYATDVFPEEPPKSLTLARHPKTIATSHIGGFTQESVTRAVEGAVENLLKALGKA